jgi:hypothetical protein
MKKLFTLCIALVAISNAHAQLSSGLVAWWTFNGHTLDAKGHTSNAKNITFTTGKTGTTNTAAMFDGSTSYITSPYTSDLNISKISICAVVKPTGYYTGLCQGNRILQRGADFTDGSYFLELYDNAYDSSCTVTGDTSHFTFVNFVGNKNPAYSAHVIYTPVITSNTWYCVIATWNDTAYRLYVNGTLKYTAYPTNPPLNTSTDSLSIGANRFADYALYPYWFKGAMDDLRLYNRALSGAEIDNYCANYSNIHPEGISNTPELSFLQVFPNPNQGSFTIKGIANDNTQIGIDVVNTLGQTIYHDVTTALNGNIEKLISLPDVPKGVYYLRLNTGEAIKTHKLLIE